MPVVLLPQARIDFDQSFDWYAKRSAETADRFAQAVENAFTRIAAQPDQFVAVDKRHRACPVVRFPFRVVYRVERNCILVVAVVHAKRRPNYWKDRTRF